MVLRPPALLTWGMVHLVPEGEGAKPLQQRPLTVAAAVYRGWGPLRHQQLQNWQEGWIHPALRGFRRRSNTRDVTCETGLDIEYHRLLKKRLVGMQYDCHKCCDRFVRQIIFPLLAAMGMGEGVLRALNGYYRALPRSSKVG